MDSRSEQAVVVGSHEEGGRAAASAVVLGVTDVDGDRAADLVIGVERADPQPSPWSSAPTIAVRVYRGSAAGFASPPVESQMSPSFLACKIGLDASWEWNTTTGDFNGDGTADFAFAGCDHVEAYLSSRSQATLQLASTVDLELPGSHGTDKSLPNTFLAVDVDGDGQTDLVSAHTQDSVGFWRGRGDGTFAPPVALAQLPEEPEPYQFFVADIDGDGRPDVIAAGSSVSGDSSIEVLLGPSGVAPALHVYGPLLPTEGIAGALLAVMPAPGNGGKGTFVLSGRGAKLHLVVGACQ